MRFSQQVYWGGLLFPPPVGSCFIRTLCYDQSILGGPTLLGSQLHWVTQTPLPWQGSDLWRPKPGECVEKQRHYSANKSPYSQGYGLLSGHLQLWVLDGKEGGALKNGCLWTVLLEKTPESPLDSKKIKPVNLKGNQLWILIGRTDAEAEAPVFWSFDANSWLIGKVIDAEKDWRQKVKRASEYEMAGWHHQCNRHELRQT